MSNLVVFYVFLAAILIVREFLEMLYICECLSNMIHFSFLEYMEISILVYLIRFILDRCFLSIKFVRNFYYGRVIFPSIRVWEKRRYKIFVDEIFAFIEILIINISYMAVYWSLPFSSPRKTFVFMFFIFLFTIIIKSRFIFTEVNYPKSLLFLDMARIIIAYTLQAVILAIFYSPLNTIYNNI